MSDAIYRLSVTGSRSAHEGAVALKGLGLQFAIQASTCRVHAVFRVGSFGCFTRLNGYYRRSVSKVVISRTAPYLDRYEANVLWDLRIN